MPTGPAIRSQPFGVWAVLLMEDRRFYQHRGVDLKALARAAWVNARSGAIRQGGSTLTQQLARGRYLSGERTFSRKIKEAILALTLEAALSKQEILERYLNEIYLGQRGILEVHGIGTASLFYLGKEPSGLRPAEVALLVGMIRSPNTTSPFTSPRRARERRDVVLRRLRLEGKLSVAEYRRALKDPVRVAKGSTVDAAHFLEFVRREVEAKLPASARSRSLKVFTTLDPQVQQAAQRAVRLGMHRIDGRRGGGRGNAAEASLVALDVETGAIKAMVGGRNYQRSQFNRAVQARRQPGSLFKPFIFLAAFEARRGGDGPALTPATVVEDRPVSLAVGSGQWTPANFESRYYGKVRVREALERSLNAATLRVAEQVGLRRVIDQARASGIHSPIRPNPATLLGASEVSLLEITAAYGTLARGGEWIKPVAIKKVTDDKGWVLFEERRERRWAASPQAAFLVTSLLQGAIDRGTAASARRLGLARSAAGKTGTSNDLRDAWFVGYTPDLVAGVWVGVDSGASLRLTAAQAALPLWTSFIEQASAGHPPRTFAPPPGIVTAKIDPMSGLRVGSGCSGGVDEIFIQGTEPTESCPEGEMLFFSWLRRIFSR
ncbi:MAG: Multimodular transpeptidase-transglycosylase [candidate division NC10 bacterium]|nr:Multimodular transpeptidase-transglycosylase [candidate division NC10 bacterium]